MPFTPKFVDLVRNVTSSTGTGAVSLGSAVSGFTSLSNAVATGEQFYYCIQGVDKPAEREVGRGTMQANGTIARQPISGPATNFTTGVKTIALIAAAEWFAKLEAGGASGGGSSQFVNINSYLASPRTPFVTDDLAAFNAALAAIGATGGTLYVPAGKYYLSATLNIGYGVTIIGDGSNQGAGGTLIRFGKNCNGMVFNYGTTLNDATIADVGHNASGASLTGVNLWGGNVNVDGAGNVTTYAAGDSTSGHGVRIRTTFVALVDVFCAFFGGDGFNIDCTAGAGGAIGGNANDFYLERCQSIYNSRYGYLIAGSDSNAGTINTCSAISNGGGGFIEYSFLGNSYIQCHARDNGKTNPVVPTGATGVCLYGGNSYYAVADKLVEASTTVPGTDATVWAPMGYVGGKPWVTGLTWLNSSPYGTNPGNANGRNVFMGCYAESAQAPCQAFAPSLFVGGLLDEVGFSPASSSGWLIASRGGMQSKAFFSYDVSTGRQTTIGHVPGINTAGDALFHVNGANSFRLYENGAGNFSISINGGNTGAFTADGLTLGGGKSLYLTPGAAPAVLADGRIWYDTAAAKFKKRQNGATSDLDTVGGVPAVSVTNEAGAAYTAVIGDAGNVLRFTSAAAVTFTIPPNSAVAFPVGSVIEFEQAGAGAVTVAPGAGVTINSRGGDLILAGQFAVAALRKVVADTWTLTGDL